MLPVPLRLAAGRVRIVRADAGRTLTGGMVLAWADPTVTRPGSPGQIVAVGDPVAVQSLARSVYWPGLKPARTYRPSARLGATTLPPRPVAVTHIPGSGRPPGPRTTPVSMLARWRSAPAFAARRPVATAAAAVRAS